MGARAFSTVGGALSVVFTSTSCNCFHSISTSFGQSCCVPCRCKLWLSLESLSKNIVPSFDKPATSSRVLDSSSLGTTKPHHSRVLASSSHDSRVDADHGSQ